MASRSLTDIFMLMRNSAVQDRNFFSRTANENRHSDRSALIQHEMDEVQISLPPEWFEEFEEIQYIFSKIRTRIKELAELQDQQLMKPILDESSEQDSRIEQLTAEITKSMGKCYRGLNQIQSFLQNCPPGSSENKLTKNVSSYLINELQTLSSDFKRAQSSYLNKLRSQEERTARYFKQPEPYLEEELVQEEWPVALTQQQQLLFLQENTAFAEQREKEVANVVKSIQDLNIIFKEIAQMISDQGTILDRIDYNIEHASVSVQQGVVHLKKAESYQKSTWKMKCVLILATVVVTLVILLIATKT